MPLPESALRARKRLYLEKNMLSSFKQGKTDFVSYCDFCNKKLNGSLSIFKNNLAYNVKVDCGQFHHADGNPENDMVENMKLYCYTCHKNVHRWGIIQRWLEKTGKTVNDLPDCRNLKPMTFGRY